MRHRKLSVATVISLLAGAVTAVGSAAAPAWADASQALALSSYSHMVVDGAHQHLFFSQGAGSQDILVTDLSGTQVGTIPNEAGATGLVLSADGSTLYAALSGADAVAAIDTATLTETTRYNTGAGTAPSSVVVSGQTVWYGYGPLGGPAGIGEIDTSAVAPTATGQPGLSHWAQAPLLAVGGGVLAAEEPEQAQSHVATFDLSAATPHAIADTWVFGGTAASLAVTSDGSRVLLAAPQRFAVESYLTSTLGSASPGAYAGGNTYGPDAAAIAADGTIATGSNIGSGPDVWVTSSGKQPMSSVAFTPSTLVPDGLAWGADGLSLYAVTKDATGGYALHTLSNPRLSDTTLGLGYPSEAVPTQQFTLPGTFTTKGVTPTGAALQVMRNGTPLPDVTVGADGTFSVTDTVPAEGAYVYQVSYAGDATHLPATISLKLDIARLSTMIPSPAFSKASSAGVVFSSTLSTELNQGVIAAGTTVQITRVNLDTKQSVALPDVPVDPATQSFTVNDVPGPGLNFRYDMNFAGNATLAPTESSSSVSFQADSPALTVHAPATSSRASRLTFTAGLSDDVYEPYAAGDQVQVTKTDLAHPGGYSLGSAPVAADGSITFADTPQIGGPNVYKFAFPGDATHTATTGSTTVQVSRAATAVSVTTNASTYAYGSTATVAAHLGTTYNGRAVNLYAKPYGGAQVLVKTGTVDAHGNLVASYAVTRSTTFTVSFAGDYQYVPATASTGVAVYARVAETLSGYYTSTYQGTTLYRVYHHTVRPGVTVAVSPNKYGECVYIQVQEYLSGSWRTAISTSCQKLGPASVVAGTLSLPGATGHLFRVLARYVRSSSDPANLANAGSWQYFTVRY